MDQIASIFDGLTVKEVVVGVTLFLGTMAFSLTMVAIVLVRLPSDYFSPSYSPNFLRGSRWYVRWGATIGKNALGGFLIVIGILLSMPGIPGQGILTILIGLILLDIPFLRPIEIKILSRPSVLAAVNRLRAKFNKEPFNIK